MPDSRVRSRAQPGLADRRLVDRDQAQRRDRDRTAHPGSAHRPPSRRRGGAATGTSRARASCRRHLPGRACARRYSPLDQSTIGQLLFLACRNSVMSGCTATGFPTAAQHRQVGVRVGVGEAACQVDVRGRRRRPAARRRGTPPPAAALTRKPVQTPRSSTASSAASMWSNSGASGRVSGRDRAGDQHRRWPAARCSRMRRTAAGDSRASTWEVRTRSAISSRSSSRAPAYSR